MTLVLTVIALVLLIEGAMPALFPNRYKAWLDYLSQQSPESFRRLGMTFCALGITLLVVINL
ncbi:DUF2065 domain-containing protein [Aliagarivorans taiwanensis]|uniref:DUF2065 domain-containing protein n=1 Tax=Aliagarivorans taiwanensis TaxID=561966 RepID=UPI000A075042|nr:DUF2065 domain-containing protein [Aliagarivorans taiwanensis]